MIGEKLVEDNLEDQLEGSPAYLSDHVLCGAWDPGDCQLQLSTQLHVNKAVPVM